MKGDTTVYHSKLQFAARLLKYWGTNLLRIHKSFISPHN